MSTNTFDTLAAAHQLRNVGFEQKQAEAIANAIRNGQGDLVTKDHLDAKLSGLESRLVKWGVGLAGAAVVIIGVLIRI